MMHVNRWDKTRIAKAWMLILIVILTFSLVGCGKSDDIQDNATLGQKYGAIFDSFSTTDIYGNPQDESSILGAKYTLVLIWSTTCNPCIDGMPKMEAIHQEYKDIGINVWGIAVDLQDQEGKTIPSTIADAVSIVDTKGVTFTNTLIPEPMMTFLYNEIQYTPTAFFVDNTGTIVSELYIGEKEYSEWSEAIEALIK
jgi:thiol-disulfide isomerase/thioredoxin